MVSLSSFFVLFILFRAAASAPVAGFCKADTRTIEKKLQTSSRNGTSRDRAANIGGLTMSEIYPESQQLYGDVRDIVATPEELAPYIHPRVIVSPNEWRRILLQYTNEKDLEKKGTWANFFFGLTLHKGPLSSIISDLVEIHLSGVTSAYDGRAYQKSSPDYENYRRRLKPLTDHVQMMDPIGSVSFFLCAFWAHVDDLLEKNVLPSGTLRRCIHATVAWSKILLSHRAYYCNPECPKSRKDRNRAFIWNMKKPWDLHDDHASAASGLALAYDVLYDRMTSQDRETVRSALALLVLKRQFRTNGNTISTESKKLTSDPNRPNALDFDHSSLYIISLAIEGEEEFDAYATSIVLENCPNSCNGGNDGKYFLSDKANLTYPLNPDEATLEDGYTYFASMREGALELVASHRRGGRLLDTPLFRNFIYNVAQFIEPWQCGDLIGHISREDGEVLHNTYIGLFNYLYPEGELPAMLWRQRFGPFENCSPYRIDWWQTMIPLAFFGSEHKTGAESPEGLSEVSKEQFKLSYYIPQRGPLVARGSHSEQTAYIRFNACPDTLFARRGDANSGTFTFSALRQTWFDSSSWKRNLDSRKRNLVHVDGLPRDESLTFAKMIRISDNGRIVIAVADLTSSYNCGLALERNNEKALSGVDSLTQTEMPFQTSIRSNNEEYAKLLGLYRSRDHIDINSGFTESSAFRKTEDDHFRSTLAPKKDYMEKPLVHVVRSVGLIRSMNDGPGLTFLVDRISAGSGTHTFESYLTMKASVSVDHGLSVCTGNYCKIILRGNKGAIVEVHCVSISNSLGFRIERLGEGANMLIMKSEGLPNEELWMALYPYQERSSDVFSIRSEEDYLTIEYEGLTYEFEIDEEDNGVASASSPPMEPVILRPWVAHGFEGDALNEDVESFFGVTNEKIQVVFKFSSLSSANGGDVDELRTCSWYTTMAAQILVFDCGSTEDADDNYIANYCKVLPETDYRTLPCSRGSHQTKWMGRLESGRTYFATVSGHKIEDIDPRFSIVHFRRRIRRQSKAQYA